ncbi:hypothetical protein M0805_009504 [Coniferiporia weirii]|nr:hypothetical protein M0805_009504 [Coniferiporia weirii]
MSFRKDRVRVAIIGCGVAGISTAIALKRQLNFENFLIYEKSSDIGGTWRDNTYPGCSSDVAGHWYSLLTDLNPNWSTHYVLQPEILAYWKSLFKKQSLSDKMVFNTSVVSAVWDDGMQQYCVTLRDEKTGVERKEYVEAIVSATGALSKPSYPKDITGMETFDGPIFHSARWGHDVSLLGKRVGVIGNAASGAQLIPRISADPTVEVINFCRTPNWYIGRPNFTYSTRTKSIFSNVPFALRLHRLVVSLRSEIGYLSFSSSFVQRLARRTLADYIKETAPKKYIDKLVPSYPLGCRRTLVDPGYLKALHQPNVTLNWNPILSIVREGVVTGVGDMVPLDVIVLATGFDPDFISIDLEGRGGRTLRGYFKEQGGPTAYMGTTVPEFPNFFIIFGPNTATGHASVIFSEEVQINYTIQLLKPIIEKKVKSFSVRAIATEAYNELIQRRLGKSVFVACTSYYRQGMTGKNFAIFPGPLMLFWWWARRPRWEDYEAYGAEAWIKERQRWKLARRLLTTGLLASLITVIARPQLRDALVAAGVSGLLSDAWEGLASLVGRYST